jgi:hypothetical protein
MRLRNHHHSWYKTHNLSALGTVAMCREGDMRSMPILVVFALSGLALVAAPVPPEPKVLVASLSDPARKVRDEAVRALTNRQDAAPWLRRAARSPDRDTSARAAQLLSGFARKRQAVAKSALDACIRDGKADLFVERHHFWQPEAKEALWLVGPEMGRAGVEVYAKQFPKWKPTGIEAQLERYYSMRKDDSGFHDGSFAQYCERANAGNLRNGPWYFRMDRLQFEGLGFTIFASVAGPCTMWESSGGYYFTLGETIARNLLCSVLVCDGGVSGWLDEATGVPGGPRTVGCFVVCRGNVVIRASVSYSTLLVDGDVDLSKGGVENSVIRASGEVRLKPGYEPKNCTIEEHAKNVTEPYKFFELADVGLSFSDDEEGLTVSGLKAGTPFGNCGLVQGDVIQGIDDLPPGHSEVFRKQVRKAMVVQGDCLLTVARGNQTLDIAVYFPTPK